MSRHQQANAERWKSFEPEVRSRTWFDTDSQDAMPANECWYQVLTMTLICWDELLRKSTGDALSTNTIRRWLSANCDVLFIRQFCQTLKAADEVLLEYVDNGILRHASYGRFKHDLRAKGGRVAYLIPLRPLVAEALGSANPDVLFGGVHQALVFPSRYNPYSGDCDGDLKWKALREWIELDASLPDPCVDLEPDSYAISFVAKEIGGWLEKSVSRWVHPSFFRFGPGRTAEVSRKAAHFVNKYSRFTVDTSTAIWVQTFTGLSNHEIDRIVGTDQWLVPFNVQSDYAILGCVPKASDKYRTITFERTGKQWVQTGFGESLVQYLAASRFFSQHVDLSRAELNTERAREGSRVTYPETLQMCTIDFSSASDRISLALVDMIFRELPITLQVLHTCRAEHFRLAKPKKTEVMPPDLEHYVRYVTRVRKYAGMGNRMTFPLECIVFTALVVSAIERCGDNPWESHFRVYGDDVVLEKKYVFTFMYLCEKYGLKINESKSFTGDHMPRFRESCGGHFLNGEDITPVYLPRRWQGWSIQAYRAPSHWPVSLCALANECYTRLPDLRLYLIWKLKELLPKHKWPAFDEDGATGLMSKSPTNYHLTVRKTGYTGPAIPELSRPGVYIPDRERWLSYQTLDFQDDTIWGEVECGTVQVSWSKTVEFSDRSGPCARGVKSLPFIYLIEALRRMELRSFIESRTRFTQTDEEKHEDLLSLSNAEELIRYSAVQLTPGYDPNVRWRAGHMWVPLGTSGRGGAAS